MYNVTGIKKRIISHAPNLALKPKMIHKAPTVAITPERGTKNEAAGTPADAAYPIVLAEKWLKIVPRKINEKSNLPKTTISFIIDRFIMNV
jgi:hypothetical protein